MYTNEGGGGGPSKSEIVAGKPDWKCITGDNHPEKASSSTPRSLKCKDRERLSLPLISAGESQIGLRHTRSVNKCSDDGTDAEGSRVSGSYRDEDDVSWISWFCNLQGNEFFCEVDADYINDFRVCGAYTIAPYFQNAVDLILDVESSDDDMFTEEQKQMVQSVAEMVYGNIHVLYILTPQGMSAMLEKYKNCDFGRCPRVYCHGQPCLPVGLSDTPRSSTVKIYCPKCEDIFHPRPEYQCQIDGKYFGATFPHWFQMTYEHLKQQKASHENSRTVEGSLSDQVN